MSSTSSGGYRANGSLSHMPTSQDKGMGWAKGVGSTTSGKVVGGSKKPGMTSEGPMKPQMAKGASKVTNSGRRK